MGRRPPRVHVHRAGRRRSTPARSVAVPQGVASTGVERRHSDRRAFAFTARSVTVPQWGRMRRLGASPFHSGVACAGSERRRSTRGSHAPARSVAVPLGGRMRRLGASPFHSGVASTGVERRPLRPPRVRASPTRGSHPPGASIAEKNTLIQVPFHIIALSRCLAVVSLPGASKSCRFRILGAASATEPDANGAPNARTCHIAGGQSTTSATRCTSRCARHFGRFVASTCSRRSALPSGEPPSATLMAFASCISPCSTTTFTSSSKRAMRALCHPESQASRSESRGT
jgi:hypothetical protein